MMDPDAPDTRAELFQDLRPRLFGIAYRMLGAVEDAEDVVQEAYLRWHHAPAAVRSAEAWLVAVVSRLSIDRLRRAATERAAYAGHWLPEPIANPAGADVPPDRATELASDLSMAFLVLLERLAPEERAAFLLREVLDAGYDEIAAALEKSEAACRQLVHRARERVRRDQRRFRAPAAAKERLLDRFLTALATEDREALVSLLADDVSCVADGGGNAPAIRQVVTGVERVVKLLLGLERQGRGRVEHRIVRINGEPALLTLSGGRTLFTTSFDSDGERIFAVYRVLNPRKLRHVGPEPLFADAWPPRGRMAAGGAPEAR